MPDNIVRPSFERVVTNGGGSVYITDDRNNCVYVLDSAGKFLFVFKHISSPTAIAVDHEDCLSWLL